MTDEEFIRVRNKTFSLKLFLSRRRGSQDMIDIDELDLDELEFVTRISPSELDSFINYLIRVQWLIPVLYEGKSKCYIQEPKDYINIHSDIKPNENFDNRHFDWNKRNTVPTKVKLSKD